MQSSQKIKLKGKPSQGFVNPKDKQKEMKEMKKRTNLEFNNWSVKGSGGITPYDTKLLFKNG